MMNKIATQVPRLCARQLTNLRAFSVTPQRMEEKGVPVSLDKVKAAQKHFQLDDGIPVYLKGGMKDYVLFGSTVFLCVIGLGYGATVIYELAVPPKN